MSLDYRAASGLVAEVDVSPGPAVLLVVSPVVELVGLVSGVVVVGQRVVEDDESGDVRAVEPPLVDEPGSVVVVVRWEVEVESPGDGNVVGASGPGPVLTVESMGTVVGVGSVSVVGASVVDGASVDVCGSVVVERVVGTVVRLGGAADSVVANAVTSDVVTSSSSAPAVSDSTRSARSMGTATMSPDRTRIA